MEHAVGRAAAGDSAGTAGHTIGSPPDHRSKEVAKQNNIVLLHEARQLKRLDLKTFDVILVMDHSNYENALKVAKNDYERGKVYLITDFDQRKQKLQASLAASLLIPTGEISVTL